MPIIKEANEIQKLSYSTYNAKINVKISSTASAATHISISEKLKSLKVPSSLNTMLNPNSAVNTCPWQYLVM